MKSAPIRSDALPVNLLVITIGLFAAAFALSPLLPGEAVSALKYAFSLAVVAGFCWCVLTFFTFTPYPGFLIAPFMLGVIGVASFVLITAYFPGRSTYGSALIPLLVCAAPLFIPERHLTMDLGRAARLIMMLCLAAGLVQLAVQASGGASDKFLSHEDTFIVLFAGVVAAFHRDAKMLAAALAIAALDLMLRPSSTLAMALLVVLTAALGAYLMRARLVSALFYWTSLVMVVLNSLVIFDLPVIGFVFQIEPFIKEQVLGASSNTEFRVAVLSATIDEFWSGSVLFGKFFGGNVNVYVRHLLPYFGDEAPIHSDFVTMGSQGGIVGAILFAALFIGFAGAARHGLRIARALGDNGAAAFFSSALGVNLIFVLYIGFNPIMQKVDYALFFLIWVPMTVFALRQLRRSAIRTRVATPLRPVVLSPTPFVPHRHV